MASHMMDYQKEMDTMFLERVTYEEKVDWNGITEMRILLNLYINTIYGLLK
jgi:hypothetical protein